MLVLQRKERQRILIGEDIWIEVVRIVGNKVRIGITAPPEMPVVREELRESEVRHEPGGVRRTGPAHAERAA